MSDKTKSTHDAKVSIPIVGDENRSYSVSSDSEKRTLNIPNLDSATLNNILMGIASPIVLLVGGLYFIGLVTSFIFYPFKFILNLLSVLYSILKFLF